MTLREPRDGQDADDYLPVCKPKLPLAAEIAPYMHRIDENGWYSNFGPLEVALRERLADRLGASVKQVMLAGSGTVAITAALIAAARDGRQRCLMPSWTFVAGAGAAVAAGLTPWFCDVDADSWALDPKTLLSKDDLSTVAAVLVTCPFGEPGDVAAWDDFTVRTGVPVVIDAAASYGALDAGALAIGRSPVVISLHATKTLGAGEGGLMLSRDVDLVERATSVTNFGFRGERIARLMGVNGKMSEYIAAVGHAALDRWPSDRDAWQAALELYGSRRQTFARYGDLRIPAWPTSTINWLAANAATAAAAEHALAAADVDTRRWWGAGCHVHPAYEKLERDGLEQTESIAARCIGLPMWQGLTAADVDRIAEVLANLDSPMTAAAR
jgi:dTDP-4-amino-4,6-dideoxygalactose transaminase